MFSIMNYKKYILSAFLLVTLFIQTGCDSIFRDEPNNKLSQKTIWGSDLLLDEYVLPLYRNMNSGFSVYMPTNSLLKGISREYLPWFADQIIVSKADWYNTAYGDILKSTMVFCL